MGSQVQILSARQVPRSELVSGLGFVVPVGDVTTSPTRTISAPNSPPPPPRAFRTPPAARNVPPPRAREHPHRDVTPRHPRRQTDELCVSAIIDKTRPHGPIGDRSQHRSSTMTAADPDSSLWSSCPPATERVALFVG